MPTPPKTPSPVLRVIQGAAGVEEKDPLQAHIETFGGEKMEGMPSRIHAPRSIEHSAFAASQGIQGKKKTMEAIGAKFLGRGPKGVVYMRGTLDHAKKMAGHGLSAEYAGTENFDPLHTLLASQGKASHPDLQHLWIIHPRAAGTELRNQPARVEPSPEQQAQTAELTGKIKQALEQRNLVAQKKHLSVVPSEGLDKAQKEPKLWLGRPVASDKDLEALEQAAAIHEFHGGHPRGIAEDKAYGDYRTRHHLKGAAHHLMSMKVAQAAGNREAAQEHWQHYDRHLKALGRKAISAVPDSVQAQVDGAEKPVYSFKGHPGDALLAKAWPRSDEENNANMAGFPSIRNMDGVPRDAFLEQHPDPSGRVTVTEHTPNKTSEWRKGHGYEGDAPAAQIVPAHKLAWTDPADGSPVHPENRDIASARLRRIEELDADSRGTPLHMGGREVQVFNPNSQPFEATPPISLRPEWPARPPPYSAESPEFATTGSPGDLKAERKFWGGVKKDAAEAAKEPVASPGLPTGDEMRRAASPVLSRISNATGRDIKQIKDPMAKAELVPKFIHPSANARSKSPVSGLLAHPSPQLPGTAAMSPEGKKVTAQGPLDTRREYEFKPVAPAFEAELNKAGLPVPVAAPAPAPQPQLHSTVEGFMGGLKALPKEGPARGKFITQHMNHPAFQSALQQHPQGKQIHAMLTSHLNSVANAGFKPGAAKVLAKAEQDLLKALLEMGKSFLKRHGK